MAQEATAGTSTWPATYDLALRRYVEGRLMGLRVNRYSWWVHWRELADFILPRRYRWLITPNQQQRGSPLNQHILDSTGTIAARNLAAGMMSGITSPTRPWFKLKVGRIDSTQTSPVSLWLAECERLMAMVFQESNFYTAMATLYFDLVVFGTATLLIYEDFDNVIQCYNPCLGEYYIDNDGKLRPCIFYREFTLTIAQTAERYGEENMSSSLQKMFKEGGSNLTREIVVAHALEPNDDGKAEEFGFSPEFKYRECYWEWGGSAIPQGGSVSPVGFLEKKGYYSRPNITVRWDLVSNDAYGRSPGMDMLPDVKQLQLETRRKAQGIDKGVNPPMIADVQLKNQPASLLPGGMTYISGMMSTGNAGMTSVYGNWRPDIKSMSEDMMEVRDRIKRTAFNDLFQTISQFQTRSNVTAAEIDARKAESMIMLGPVFERIHFEGHDQIIDRVWGVMVRANIFPPPPQEIAGQNIDIEYISMLETAQSAAETAGIERLLGISGNLAGIDPQAIDNIDIDFCLDKYSSLLNNSPRCIRSPEELASIRSARQQAQAQQMRAEQAEKLAKSAKVLSETDTGAGQNALQRMTGVT